MTLSGFWTEALWDFVNDLWHAALLFGIFCLGAASRVDQVFRTLAFTLLLVQLPLALVQLLGLTPVAAVNVPAALFINKNLFGEVALLIFVAMLSSKSWWLAGVAGVCIILSGERASMLIAVIAILLILPTTPRRMFAAAGVAALFVAVALFQVRDSSSLESLRERGRIWSDTIEATTVLGSGLGSYWVTLPRHEKLLDSRKSRAEYAHNEYLHAIYELGIGAGLLFALGIYCLSGPRGPSRPASRVLWAVAGLSVFTFPLHVPLTAALAAVCAGHVCRSRTGLRRGVDSVRDEPLGVGAPTEPVRGNYFAVAHDGRGVALES